MSTDLSFSYDQYDLMVSSGVFDGKHRQRVELIRGDIRPMSPIGAMHEVLVDRLAEWSFLNAPREQVWVRVQNSIGLPALESVPQPDIAWVARKAYSDERPQAEDVLLIVEVADSSLRYDTGEKAQLYAEAGIRDYWVVDARHRPIIIFRDADQGRYQNPGSEATGTVSPLEFPQAILEVAELFRDL